MDLGPHRCSHRPTCPPASPLINPIATGPATAATDNLRFSSASVNPIPTSDRTAEAAHCLRPGVPECALGAVVSAREGTVQKTESVGEGTVEQTQPVYEALEQPRSV